VSTSIVVVESSYLRRCCLFQYRITGNSTVWSEFGIHLLTAIGLTPGGSSTLHIYKQTRHRTTQIRQTQLTTEQHK